MDILLTLYNAFLLGKDRFGGLDVGEKDIVVEFINEDFVIVDEQFEEGVELVCVLIFMATILICNITLQLC